MTDIFKIIRKILDNEGNIDTHDPAMMANIYAGQCQTLNDRLKECSGYLQKRMIPQALAVAQQEPPLIRLCEEMGHLETAGWADMCREKGWQMQEPLNRHALNQLKDTIERETAIAPLLKALRQANNLGNAGQCVAILREIVKADSGNARWREQLIEFETYRLQQIPAEFETLRKENALNESSLKTSNLNESNLSKSNLNESNLNESNLSKSNLIENNLNDVAKLMLELKRDWLIPVDMALVQEVEEFIHAGLTATLKDQEKNIIRNIDAAYRNQDVQALGKAVAALQNLEKSRYFKADEGLKPLYDKAMAWYRQKVKEFNEQKIRSEILSHIEEKIANRTDQGLKELWEKLKGFDESLPRGLEENIQAVMAEAGEARHRRQKRKRNRNSLLMAAAAVCLALFFIFFYFKGVQKDLLTSVDQAFLSEDIAGFNAALNEMSYKYAFLFRAEDIRREQIRASELAALLDQKKMEFKMLILRLEETARQGFIEHFEIVEKLFQEAQKRKNALGMEEKQRLMVVQNSWEQKKMMMKAADEKALAIIFTELAAGFENLSRSPAQAYNRGAENRDDVTLYKTDIRNYFQPIELLLTKAETLHMSLISVAMKDKLLGFSKKLETMKSTLKVRDAQIKAIHDAYTLEEYLKALKTFSMAFPDDPVSRALEPVNRMTSLYENLMTDPLLYDPDNLFWGTVSENIKGLNNNIKLHMNEVKEDLKKMERTPRFVDMWECTVKKPNRKPEKWYFSGEPAEEYINGILSYSGIAYIRSPIDTQPEFQAVNAIKVHVKQLQKMPHCSMVLQMIDHIAYDPGVETIIREMQYLYRQDVPPILKFHLMNFLLKELFILTGRENAASFATMAEDFKHFKNEVHWLCNTHRKYKMESRKADAILKSHFKGSDVADTYLARLKIQNIAVRRLPRWVGFVDPEDKNQLHFKTGSSPKEIWVVRKSEKKNEGQPPTVFVTQEQNFGKTVKHLDHRGYLPGEPLFAPYDNNITREVLHSILDNLNFKMRSGESDLFWPPVWPVNVRDIVVNKP